MLREADRRLGAADFLPAPPPGMNPLKAGRHRTSGLLPTFKAPPRSLAAYIYTSALEKILGLWFELHPLITVYGRVDVHADAAASLGIKPVPGMALCNSVQYVHDGKIGFYLPDVGARWIDGAPVLGEAGRPEDKSSDEAKAAFEAAQTYVGKDGHFFLLLAGDISRKWLVRALWLHLWRFAYYGRDELLADMDAAWRQPRSARSLMEIFADRDRPAIVRHAALKVAGDALAAGRFDHDLDRTDFDLDTTTRLLAA